MDNLLFNHDLPHFFSKEINTQYFYIVYKEKYLSEKVFFNENNYKFFDENNDITNCDNTIIDSIPCFTMTDGYKICYAIEELYCRKHLPKKITETMRIFLHNPALKWLHAFEPIEYIEKNYNELTETTTNILVFKKREKSSSGRNYILPIIFPQHK